ncbi:MAG: EAL and HDOD domain-containing protein [Colwellia sp.]
MLFYAARQPIFKEDKKLFGYELLFRDGIDNVFPDVDGDQATSKIVEASKFNINISDFTANKPAFINFTLDTLEKGLPEILDPNEVIVEIVETLKPGKKLLNLCEELHLKGYKLALDDYEHENVWLHFFPFIEIIKIDFRKSNAEEISQIIEVCKKFKHIKLLAEKIESYEEYEQAKSLGFTYFQGFFFAKPEMIKAKNLSPSQLSMAELLYETSKTEIDLNNITTVFERDVSLSYKLLRYANSAIFKRRSEISTIKQALVTLGSGELQRFLGLMFAVTSNDSKPNELIKTAMIRAKFCELTAVELKGNVDISSAFLTGLLSMIDAILDETMENILEKLPLSQEIKDTLMTKKGVLAGLITLVELIEHANWDKTTLVIDTMNLDKEVVNQHYNNAVLWADEQSDDE